MTVNRPHTIGAPGISKPSRLRIARLEAGLRQFDLPQLVGVNELTISRFETGRMTPSQDLRTRISEVLGKPGYELFTQ